MIHATWKCICSFVSERFSTAGSRKRRYRRSVRTTALRTEWLEPRQLLSANQIYYDAATSAIVIEGTSAIDSAQVWVDGANIQVSLGNAGGAIYATFARSTVEMVQFIGSDGNDRLANSTDLMTWAWGGGGSDELIGGTAENHLYGGEGDDRLYGKSAANFLDGQGGNDLLVGGAGDDTLLGGAGDDEVRGEDGQDLLYGQDGNDFLDGQAGNDVLVGGLGNDYMLGSVGDDRLFGEAGEDELNGQDGIDYLDGGADNDRLLGGLGNDNLVGGAGDEEIHGEEGDDQLDGQDGNDYLVGGDGDDLLIGGFGEDNLLGSGGFDRMYGGDDDDQLYGQDGNDFLDGMGGNDRVMGGLGDDKILAGAGDDTVYGEEGSNRIYGEAGNDLLSGGSSNDLIFGGTGDDYILGETGRDGLFGGDGRDVIYGQDGDDVLSGGADDDRLVGGLGNDYLLGGAGNDELYGEEGHDQLFGHEGNDYLAGADGNDVLIGGSDNDYLLGEIGDDRLYGEHGNDQLYGQEGHDYLNGGAGDDAFDGGAGNDLLVGELGNDSLDGGIGDDGLLGGAGNDRLNGQWGNDYVIGGVGDDSLIGGTENDVLIGGDGVDQLQGHEGDDILIGARTTYDEDPIKLSSLAAAWALAAPYATRISAIEDELFTAFLESQETVFDDQVADTLFGNAGQDWFFLTGYLGIYSPLGSGVHDHTHEPENATAHQHSEIIVDVLPELEGFEFIDSLDKFGDRQTNEAVHSLIPHSDNQLLQREHLSLFELVRYDQVTHLAIQSGAWSDPATWQNGQVPTANARVLIPINVEVQVDAVISTRLATVRVDGILSFDATRNTELRVDTVVVASSGSFEMGTADRPIASGVTARLLITDNGPINRTWDPFGISRGLISHGSVTIHGSAVGAFDALSIPPVAGAQTLTLSAVPVGWKIGDRIVIASATEGAEENEVREIRGINGNVILLDRPLSYNHVPPAAGLTVHVANLTRNAVIESESSVIDRRGHVMFMHNRDVHISYAGFYRLGRTNKLVAVNDPVVSSDWVVQPGTGTNTRGRYSVHFHRNGLTNDGNPSTIEGSVVDDSAGWGFVNHSSYVNMTSNVAFDVHGAGFTTEAGDEIGGFYRNMAIGSTGSTDDIVSRVAVQDFGFQGDGFWFQGSGISVVGNVSAGNQAHAFVFYSHGLIEGGVQREFLAANLPDPSIANGAKTIPVFLVPVGAFSDNIGYASGIGLQVRNHLENSTHGQKSVFEDSTFWNNTWGISLRYTQYTILRRMTVIHGPSIDLLAGIGSNNVQESNITYDNVHVSGYYIGIIMPRWGTNTVIGGTFENALDIVIPVAATRDRSVLLTGLPAQTRVEMSGDLSSVPGSTVASFMVRDTVLLNFGPFVNQRLYSLIQQSTAVPFPVPRFDAPVEYIGLTNQQLWERFRVAIGNAIAPGNAFTVPTIGGLIAPRL